MNNRIEELEEKVSKLENRKQHIKPIIINKVRKIK